MVYEYLNEIKISFSFETDRFRRIVISMFIMRSLNHAIA